MLKRTMMGSKVADASQMKAIWALISSKRYMTMGLVSTCPENQPRSTWTLKSIILSITPSWVIQRYAPRRQINTSKTASSNLTKEALNLGCLPKMTIMVEISRVAKKKTVKSKWSIWITRYLGQDWSRFESLKGERRRGTDIHSQPQVSGKLEEKGCLFVYFIFRSIYQIARHYGTNGTNN